MDKELSLSCAILDHSHVFNPSQHWEGPLRCCRSSAKSQDNPNDSNAITDQHAFFLWQWL